MQRLVLFLVCAVLAGAALWFAFGQTLLTRYDRVSDDVAAPPARLEGREIPSGWKEYRNESYRFSVLVPETMAVRAIEEGEGAATITFEQAEEGRGFQIFIVPYSKGEVSAERFRRDVPSGVRKNPKDITIDGATASSFYSTNLSLGETAEVWFIHDGFLYEVTTLAPLADWLSDIMQMWKFLPVTLPEA